MTAGGESAIAGLLAGLPDVQGVHVRFGPVGHANAAAATGPVHTCCWGVENREAAVRFLIGGRAIR